MSREPRAVLIEATKDKYIIRFAKATLYNDKDFQTKDPKRLLEFLYGYLNLDEEWSLILRKKKRH